MNSEPQSKQTVHRSPLAKKLSISPRRLRLMLDRRVSLPPDNMRVSAHDQLEINKQTLEGD